MNSRFLPTIEVALSARRLSAYYDLNGSNTDVDVLTHYVWNMRLCESFYPALQALEIVFRNSIHESICAQQNNPQWLRSTCPFIRNQERQMILNAENQLVSQGKSIDSDRLVAELNFGFWTSLLNRHYEQRGLWPRLLRPVFPHIPRYLRTRQTIAQRLNKLRHFRNRIFHHETIWHFADISHAHDDIMETIGWMSPEMRQVVGIVDDFPRVCQPSCRDELKRELLSSIA